LGERKSRTLDGWAANAYEACSETFRTASALHDDLMGRGGDVPSLDVLNGALDELVADHNVMFLCDQVLRSRMTSKTNAALPLGRHQGR